MRKFKFCLLALVLFAAFVLVRAENVPIEIESASDLRRIAENPGAEYILTRDIDMRGQDWQPLAFSGRLNGNGHSIYNLSVTRVGDVRANAVDGNHKAYDTAFAALFSVVENACIQNLTLLNVDVDVRDEGDCFAAGIAGYMTDTTIANCRVSGRVTLRFAGAMGGVAGVVGFGDGTVENTRADVTLTFVDENEKTKCEQFLGGICACGYVDIDGCDVRIDGYASVHGYAHSGGVVGMYHVHKTGTPHDGYVRNCTAAGSIRFFEHNRDRRAYCAGIIGEPLNARLKQTGNTEIHFESTEYKTYDTPLLPEMCASPSYSALALAPTCTEFGYTTFTCANCGYAYTDNYIPPAHTPGEWRVLREPAYDAEGQRALLCGACGEVMEMQSVARLESAGEIVLSAEALTMDYRKSTRLTAKVLPESANNVALHWTSSDESVASVSQDGTVLAVGRGDAVVACSSADGRARAECAVTVRYNALQWLVETVYFGWLWY